MTKHPAPWLALGAACLLVLGGCGAGATNDSNAQAAGTGQAGGPNQAMPAPSASGGAAPQPSDTKVRTPGVIGEIAEADDGLLQVQDATSQTAVSYTSTTTITAEVAGALSDIKVGSCVVARSEAADNASSSTDSANGATPTTPTEITATTIQVTEPVDGECAAMGGGAVFSRGTAGENGPSTQLGGPDGPGAPPSDMPMPSAMPSGAPNGAVQQFSGNRPVAGLVTAVQDGTLTVSVTEREPGSTASKGAKTTSAVKTTADTKVTTTKQASASALVEGQCVAATGKQDTDGTMAATTLRVFAPTDGQCAPATMQFRGPGDTASNGTGDGPTSDSGASHA